MLPRALGSRLPGSGAMPGPRRWRSGSGACLRLQSKPGLQERGSDQATYERVLDGECDHKVDHRRSITGPDGTSPLGDGRTVERLVTAHLPDVAGRPGINEARVRVLPPEQPFPGETAGQRCAVSGRNTTKCSL